LVIKVKIFYEFSCIITKSHGGYGYFKFLVTGHNDKKPFGYWKNENNIVLELQALINKLGRLPKYSELGLVKSGIEKSHKGINYFFNLVKL
jgi:ribonuclease HI